MPIKVPRSATFIVVSQDDSSLDSIPPEAMRAYEASRNFDELKPYVDELEEKPTMFYCQPLRPEFQRKVPALMIPSVDVNDLWEVFAFHVERIEHLVGDNGKDVIVEPSGKGKERAIPDRFRGDDDHAPTIPMSTFREIAQVIVHKGTRSDDNPFSLLGTWAQSRRSRMRAHHAHEVNVVRLAETAKRILIDSSKPSQKSASSTGNNGANESS